ncbi:MAG: cysteine desulfurase-like protein [Actinomycetes bacterium]
MTYNVERIRADFPSLTSGVAHFDGPGGSQVPASVAQAVAATLISPISNRGTITESERNAEKTVVDFRSAVSDLLNCQPNGVIFGRSWTQISYDLSRAMAKEWAAGDEIVVTRLEHDSNLRPWIQAAQAVGAIVRWAEIDVTTGELPLEAVRSVINKKTKLVTVTGASNILGTRPEIIEIGKAARAVGAIFVVDGVHLTPHAPIDVKKLGADIYGFSSYKLLGPHCGIAVGDPALLEKIHNDKLLPSTMVVPERFEFGTLPYEILAGVTASIDYVAGMLGVSGGTRRERIVASMTALEEYEANLFAYMETEIKKIPGIKTYGHAKNRTPTLYFNLNGVEPIAMYHHLAKLKVNAPASNFYSIEPSRALGLGDAGAVRAGLAPYSTRGEVDRLIEGINSFTL